MEVASSSLVTGDFSQGPRVSTATVAKDGVFQPFGVFDCSVSKARATYSCMDVHLERDRSVQPK